MKVQIIEWRNMRVLTSEQLAESFGAEIAKIRYNFSYNKDRYEEGKHFIVLQGEDRTRFLNEFEIQTGLKHAHTIYLWTEKGAFLHAKSLNTKKAWDAYSMLIDDYFKRVEEQKANFTQLSPQLQFMILTEQRQNELEARQLELQSENEALRNDMRHLSLVVDNEVWVTEPQKSDMRTAVNKRIGELKSQHIDAHFQGLYGDLKTFFQVSKYDKIARKDYEQAIEFIKGWFPKKKENLS